MDKERNAIEQLKKGIADYVNQVIEKAPMDKTVTALIKRVNNNNTYDILINNITYKNIKTMGGVCKTNESVKVMIPQNNYNNMFILKAQASDSPTPTPSVERISNADIDRICV